MPVCRNCGHDLAEGTEVCEWCRTPVSASAPPSAPSYAAPPPSYVAPPPPFTPPPASSWSEGPAQYPPGYGYAGPGYPPPPGRTNGLAIASLVCSLVGFVSCGLGSIVGVVLGHIAMGQIKRSGGREEGRGLAVAGLAVGYVMIGLAVAWFVIVIVASAADSS